MKKLVHYDSPNGPRVGSSLDPTRWLDTTQKVFGKILRDISRVIREHGRWNGILVVVLSTIVLILLVLVPFLAYFVIRHGP